jgi:hypothetical protein
VVRHGNRTGLGQAVADEDIEELVAASMWYPKYVPVVAGDVATAAAAPLCTVAGAPC